MTRIGIILGSTRPNRNGEQVAKWVYGIASQRSDAEFELIDLRDYPLPHLDEPLPPSMGQYQNEHTRQWAEKIASFDGFVFVTPEYNHSTSGVLKNAIDFLYAEWNNKAVGFVSYGAVGGARAAEHLRLVAGELQMADVRQQVALSLLTEFENFSVFKPGDYIRSALDTLLDQVIAWSSALAPLREPARDRSSLTIQVPPEGIRDAGRRAVATGRCAWGRLVVGPGVRVVPRARRVGGRVRRHGRRRWPGRARPAAA
jgi:NAD(P)H-dependent FMN reductase